MSSFKMNEMVRREWIKASLEATNRDDAIKELCSLLLSHHGLSSPDALWRTVMKYEKLGAPTSLFREGFAFPHSGSSLLRGSSIVVGKFRSPITWTPGGSDKVHTVLLIVGPKSEEISYCVLLLNEYLNNVRARDLLKKCVNPEDIYRFLTHIGVDLDRPTGFRLEHIIEPSFHRVRSLSWAPDERLAYAVGHGDNSVSIFSSDRNAYMTLTGHGAEVMSIAWSPDGVRLASGSADKTIRIWIGHDLKLERVIPTDDNVHQIAWSPDGKMLSAACHLRHVRRWDVTTGEEVHPRLGGWMEPALCVAWSHDGRMIAAAGGRMSQGFLVWDAVSGDIVKKHEVDDGPLVSIAWSSDDAFLAVGLGNGFVQLWEANNWKMTKNLRAQDEVITCLNFSSTDDLLASKSADGSVRIWKVGTWDMLADLPDPGAGDDVIAPLALHPQQPKMATLGGYGNMIRIWSISPKDLIPAPKHVSDDFGKLRIPNALINDIGGGRAILFAGAGISAKTLGITSSDLKSRIGELIKKDYRTYDYSTRSFEQVMDEFSELADLPTLLSTLANLIPQNIPPSKAHHTAVRLFKRIVTTNWDLLLEDACAVASIQRQVICTEDSIDSFSHGQQEPQCCHILKIHGSVDKPTSIVTTNNQYDTFHITHPKTLDVIAELLASKTVLFVGYGLGDSHIRRILETVRMEKGRLARRAYIVGLFDEVRLAALRKHHGFEVIECDADSFFSELETRVS